MDVCPCSESRQSLKEQNNIPVGQVSISRVPDDNIHDVLQLMDRVLSLHKNGVHVFP